MHNHLALPDLMLGVVDYRVSLQAFYPYRFVFGGLWTIINIVAHTHSSSKTLIHLTIIVWNDQGIFKREQQVRSCAHHVGDVAMLYDFLENGLPASIPDKVRSSW